MLEITLVRHGQTDANLNGILQGSGLDMDLNEHGRQQAKLTAEHLKERNFTMAFSSPLLRARNTAETILRYHRCSLTIEPLIAERSYGALEGHPVSEHHKQREMSGSNQFEYQPKGGEAWPAVMQRAALFKEMLEGLYQGHETKRILIVGHGGFNRAFITVVQNLPVSELMRFDQANACINSLSKDSSTWILQQINFVNHLTWGTDKPAI